MTLPVLHRLLLRLSPPLLSPPLLSPPLLSPPLLSTSSISPGRAALDETLNTLRAFEARRPGLIQALDAGEADGEHGNPRLQHYRRMVTLALADVAQERMTPADFAEQLETLALEDNLFSKFSHRGGDAR